MNKNEKGRDFGLTQVEISKNITREERDYLNMAPLLGRTRTMLFALLLCFCVYPLPGFADGVVLWNKLGNQYEVTHSDFGPNGNIHQGDAAIVYAPVQFGNGMNVQGVGEDPDPSMVTFNFSSETSYSGNKGTMAFWVKPDHDSNYSGIGRWLDSKYSQSFSPSIYWRGWDQGILFAFCAQPFQYGCWGSPRILVPNSKFSFHAGDVFHVALVWDRDGIDGTSDNLRAYINGELYGSTKDTWDSDQKVGELYIGGDDYAQSAAIDNLVIWNYAKTDFSDRFNENPVSQTFSTFTPTVLMKLGPKSHDDSFKVLAKFGLGAENDGIDPVSESVGIKIGSFSTTIPAGEFQQQGLRLFTFEGAINKVNLKAQIHMPQNSSHVSAKWFKPMDYRFKLEATGADLDGTVIPPEVKLTIGDDTGQTKFNGGKAQFGESNNDKHKDDEQWLSGGD